jgi:hypothetical protein
MAVVSHRDFQRHVSELFNTQENVVYTGVSVITETPEGFIVGES